MNKRKSLAWVLAAALPVMVHAQGSVTLYGVIDEGINYPVQCGREKALYNLSSGVIQGSRWGLKGREDLGGGTAAIFVLEKWIRHQYRRVWGKAGRMFGRQAYVGLSSNRYGALMLGRQYDSVVTSLGEFAVGDQWGGYITAHPGDLDNFNNTIRTNNAIKYTSSSFRWSFV
ncbi:porin [Paraburkholderia dipogonis]|uniref:porin n=1 Tax=Paraburkholderia dipogonis TaxID=1211383 RepID=UPI0035EB452B